MSHSLTNVNFIVQGRLLYDGIFKYFIYYLLPLHLFTFYDHVQNIEQQLVLLTFKNKMCLHSNDIIFYLEKLKNRQKTATQTKSSKSKIYQIAETASHIIQSPHTWEYKLLYRSFFIFQKYSLIKIYHFLCSIPY